jgi:DNA mismatch repair ATPase MutS
MGDQCDNGHFVDQMDMGKMAFDYKLRPGIVSGSNAAGLMRAIGIELVET